MVKHIVLLSFKDSISTQTIDSVIRFFQHISSSVSGVLNFEYGLNVCNESCKAKYSHCIVIDFRSELAKERYLVHKEHIQLKERLLKIASDIDVVDINLLTN
ncbi:Dabb family protein [Escherichia coli]|uniref:Dabb family protein n=1 Tax=Escherichia coli TaxID=562 RepID=UPI0003EE8065